MTPSEVGQDPGIHQPLDSYAHLDTDILDATRITIRIPHMTAGGKSGSLRRSSRLHTGSDDAGPSGSEYQQSERSVMDEDEAEKGMEEEEEEEKPILTKTSRGRTVVKVTYIESENDEDAEGDPDAPADDLLNFAEDNKPRTSRGRRSAEAVDDEDDEHPPRRSTRRHHMDDFIVEDEETHGYTTRLRKRKPPPPKTNGRATASRQNTAESREARARRRQQKKEEADGGMYVDEPSSPNSADADGSFDDEENAPVSDDMDLEMDPEPEPEEEEPEPEADGKPYSLRQRTKINYAIPPPLEDMTKPLPPKQSRGGGGRAGWHGRKNKGPGWSATGAELGKWMGLAADDSDSDVPTRTPRKAFGLGAFDGAVAGGGGGLLPGDLAAAGTPSNLGKIGDSTLADADPLGVNVNVTFDEVGGLEDHINSLKEMTVLPLLYPEVFQQFNVTPPRGVLFHGPPGTGKTLLARALAASCRSNGRRITFFMRKGADALSKWVGEAERQLRLLFEEARASQPSIIFFDEIDGLAPVRSSKQDQIHASIVSTLLALMDGMDGRGQVVVIGATNRPDAIDPALRRPGRFDREFYFPLPGLEAREKILKIMTKGWKGWGDDEKSEERIKGLAKLTKGYGGADLRALCTEAALNAVQRKYPQIYKSNDRLLLQPDSIAVGLRDFMISIKKLVPSSARSSASAAAPLPPQFAPLLQGTLEKVKIVISHVLPIEKKRTALEEAEYEDYEGEEGALEREMTLQSMETLRIYRPRVILHGPVGMGQSYVGAALLHHLEGYHVQSLELGTLLGDSARTVEAAIVQLFVEAKRHQPSVVYIPSLVGWCSAISETARSTVRAMLDTLAPTDPILLLAIVDGKFADLPRDVRGWFGPTKDNRVELPIPTASQREHFFKGLIEDIRRPPNQFADGMVRKKRVLEELPIAPPLEPRQPSAAELALQVENDQRTITLLKYRLGPILTELKRKFKRFTKRATDEYDFSEPPPPVPMAQAVTATIQITADGTTEIVPEAQQVPIVNGFVNGVHHAADGVSEAQQVPVIEGLGNGVDHAPESTPQVIAEPVPQVEQPPPLYDMDLERMHIELYKGRYLTPQEFMDDITKIVHNAAIRAHEDLDRHYKAQAMKTATEVSMHEFDPALRMECERMAVRERKRREEYRRNKEEKEKEKAKSSSADPAQTQPNGTRRSARNNGLQPELAITDPVKLERKLKRQREGGGASTDSNGSEEENGEGRDAKRSKILLGIIDDADRDPLDITTPPSHTPPRTTGVRFASTQPEPATSHWQSNGNEIFQAEAGTSAPPPTMMPSQSPYSKPMIPAPFAQQDTFRASTSLPPISQLPSIHFSDHLHFHAPSPSIQAQSTSEAMILDPPHLTPPRLPYSSGRSTGFDALLNPMVPDSEQPMAGPSSSLSTFQAYNAPVSAQDENPFLVAPQQAISRYSSSPRPTLASILHHSRSKTPESATQLPSPSSPSPMPIIVERTPTPLPNFHVDDNLVRLLEQSLREHTSSLTIEELEQLRATCLGCVWRHRKEWDRDKAVDEMIEIVKEFVQEVQDGKESEGRMCDAEGREQGSGVLGQFHL